jgi:hypothetical protein
MLIDEGKDVPEVQFEKFNILKTGIALRFIPALTPECKKQLEGSFKIVADPELQEKTTLSADNDDDLTDDDKLLMRFFVAEGKEPDKAVGNLTNFFHEVQET